MRAACRGFDARRLSRFDLVQFRVQGLEMGGGIGRGTERIGRGIEKERSSGKGVEDGRAVEVVACFHRTMNSFTYVTHLIHLIDFSYFALQMFPSTRPSTQCPSRTPRANGRFSTLQTSPTPTTKSSISS
jgi:hypothetical protein